MRLVAMIRVLVGVFRLWVLAGLQRWRHWRSRQVAVGSSIAIHSIRVCGVDLRNSPVSGALFSEFAVMGSIKKSIRAGQEISLDIENLSRFPVPFRGLVMMRLAGGERTMLPIPLTVLLPGQRQTVAIYSIVDGLVMQFMIP